MPNALENACIAHALGALVAAHPEFLDHHLPELAERAVAAGAAVTAVLARREAAERELAEQAKAPRIEDVINAVLQWLATHPGPRARASLYGGVRVNGATVPEYQVLRALAILIEAQVVIGRATAKSSTVEIIPEFIPTPPRVEALVDGRIVWVKS